MFCLALHPGALGDVILLGQFLQRYRPMRLALAAGAEKARLLHGLGAVDQAVDIESLPLADAFADRPLDACTLPAALERLGLRRPDLLISCLAAGTPAAEDRLTRLIEPARARVAGVSPAGCERVAGVPPAQAYFLPIRPEARFPGHLLDLWSQLTAFHPGRCEFVPPSAPAAPWTVPNDWMQQARLTLAQAGVNLDLPFVVIHPGAGSPAKCWPLENFLALAGLLAARGTAPVFVLGPAEQDWWGAETIATIRAAWPVIQSPELATLAGLLAQARTMVANDSGPAHLATSVGTPTVALFGRSNLTHFAPQGPHVRIIHNTNLPDLSAQTVLAAMSI